MPPAPGPRDEPRGRRRPAGDAPASSPSRRPSEGLLGDHRTVIRLVHEEGLTLAQAAERMGRSLDAVRRLYARALARLADRVDAGEAPGAHGTGDAPDARPR